MVLAADSISLYVVMAMQNKVVQDEGKVQIEFSHKATSSSCHLLSVAEIAY